jgi:nucleoside-diphosphate-sugar epimerase
MNNRQVCVTGARGFVGRKLVEQLIERGYSVRVLTRTFDDSFPKMVQVFTADLTSLSCDLGRFFSGCDIFFHCAGEIKNTKVMQDLHVSGTKRLRDALLYEIAIANHEIHWVQLSSAGVYGIPPKNPSEYRIIREDSAIRPSGVYEITKAESDQIMLASLNLGGITGTVLRPSNIVGLNMPNQSFTGLLKSIINKYFFYIGSRNAVSNYVHVDDVVSALILCGESQLAKGQVFNLSNDCLLSDIVEAVSHSNCMSSKRLVLPEFFVRLIVDCVSRFIKFPLTNSRIDSLVSRTFYSSDKIKTILSFSPKFLIPEFSIEYLKKSTGG